MRTDTMTDSALLAGMSGSALLATLCAALKFLEFTVSLLDFALGEFRWCTTAWAGWLGLESSKADGACAYCWRGGIVALAAWFAVEGPCTEIVRPTMTVNVADMIKDDRVGFVRGWAKDATNLLQVEAKAGCWSQEDCCCDGWNVGAFRDHVNGCEDLDGARG